MCDAPQSAMMTESHPSHEHRSGRLTRFGREHPALAVAGIAGAGLLGGIEMAAGVLLGAGVAALLRRPNGQPMTERSAEERGRIRRVLDQTPHDLHELKERARAVLLAARGKITAPAGNRNEPAPPSGPDAGSGAAV